MRAGELVIRAANAEMELANGQMIADITILNDRPIEMVAARLREVCYSLLEQ